MWPSSGANTTRRVSASAAKHAAPPNGTNTLGMLGVMGVMGVMVAFGLSLLAGDALYRWVESPRALWRTLLKAALVAR